MTRVPFGTKASPFLLNATLQHHLKTVEGPLAGTADLLSQSFYVDDLLVGAPKDREAVKLLYEANDMIEATGMKLRKWASNSQYLRKLFVACEGCLSSETQNSWSSVESGKGPHNRRHKGCTRTLRHEKRLQKVCPSSDSPNI